MSNYKVAKSSVEWKDGKLIPIDENEYDVIMYLTQKGLTMVHYQIVKNTPNLSDEELADICDAHNFGHHRNGNRLTVYTD